METLLFNLLLLPLVAGSMLVLAYWVIRLAVRHALADARKQEMEELE
ncbi:hypothetical protein [Cellulomonas bogoriensis]|nr:hypothetical protein [Cellulomonas bogoriensis]